MAILPDSGKFRRHLAAFLAFLFTILVVVTTVTPHFHDCKDIRSTVAAKADHHSLSTAVAFCPVCDWLASSCIPATAPVVVHHLPILNWTPAPTPVLAYLFGLVEPLHSPQRGPPSFSHIVSIA